MINNIQAFRALAVLLVVANHAAQQSARVGSGSVFFETGAAGVDIFFVISGFIMCHITESAHDARRFMLSRFVRVAPTYYLVTALMAFAVAEVPQFFKTSIFDIGHVISSFLFIAWPHPTMRDAIPIYLPGWTLNYEFFFYVTFALFIPLNIMTRIVITSSVLLCLAVLRILPVQNAIYDFYTSSILIEFVYGMIVYWLHRNVHYHSRVGGLLLLAGSAIALVAVQYVWPTARGLENRFIVWGIPAALMVYSGLWLESSKSRVKAKSILFIGDASYSIYLTHLFTVGIVAVIWGRLHVPVQISDLGLIVACLIASTAVGSLFHVLLELPILRIMRGFLANRRKASLLGATTP